MTETGGGGGAKLVEELTQRCSGLRISSDRCGVALRTRTWGHDGTGLTGGDELTEVGSLPEFGGSARFGRCRGWGSETVLREAPLGRFETGQRLVGGWDATGRRGRGGAATLLRRHDGARRLRVRGGDTVEDEVRRATGGTYRAAERPWRARPGRKSGVIPGRVSRWGVARAGRKEGGG